MPVPLGFHSEPAPYPGVESVRMEGLAGRAGRAIAAGMEALGDLAVSLPGTAG